MRRLLAMLSIALLAAGCRCEGAPLARFASAGFETGYPAGWVLRRAGPGEAFFDGTTARGAFAFGGTMTVVLEAAPAAPTSAFAHGCGSHVCDTSLVTVRDRFRLTLTEACPTDSCPSEEAREQALRALAERILPTLRERP